jgi:hypothetical protein
MAGNGLIAQRFKQLSPQKQASRLRQRFEAMDDGYRGYPDRNDWNGS